MIPTRHRQYILRCLSAVFLCLLMPTVQANAKGITDIHLVLNSLSREGNWWGVTEVHVWDEKGKIVRPLKIDAKRRSGTSNNFDSATGALHSVRINDRAAHTGWAPRVGGVCYDHTLGAATLNIHLPRPVKGGLLAVSTWPESKKMPRGKRSAGIASGRIFFRYGGPTTFHEFRSIRNPGGVGSPDRRQVHATYFGETPKRR